MRLQSIADNVTMTRQLITWIVISNSLDIDFIHGDIHGRSCKNVISQGCGSSFVPCCGLNTGRFYLEVYPSGLFHWHWGNLPFVPVPVKQPWKIRAIDHMNPFIRNKAKQNCAYFMGYILQMKDIWNGAQLHVTVKPSLLFISSLSSNCYATDTTTNIPTQGEKLRMNWH